MIKDNNINDEKSAEIVAGRNAVTEALRSGRNIDIIFIQKGDRTGSISAIIKKAREKGITIKDADHKKLDFLSGGAVHQGVVAKASVIEYSSLEDAFAIAEERGEKPFFIICDEITDPQNLGAIIRTAECSGAHAVIIPKRRSVSLTYAVGKASAGAVEYVPVVKVSNLVDTIEKLKEKGMWVYATDMDGQLWCDTDYSDTAVAVIIGSEGKGISKLLKEKSDYVVSLPMKGKISSLNASVACGVICYEIMRQRALKL